MPFRIHYSTPITNNFLRTFYLPVINLEVELNLSWIKDCLLIEDHSDIITMITSTKFYVPVVTLSRNDDINFLENLKKGFKMTISWNKYIPETTTQTKNNSLDYI